MKNNPTRTAPPNTGNSHASFCFIVSMSSVLVALKTFAELIEPIYTRMLVKTNTIKSCIVGRNYVVVGS